MNMNLIESPFISDCPSTCLSPLWPASVLARDPYAYAMLNNPAADAELFLSEWIQCVKKKMS